MRGQNESCDLCVCVCGKVWATDWDWQLGVTLEEQMADEAKEAAPVKSCPFTKRAPAKKRKVDDEGWQSTQMAFEAIAVDTRSTPPLDPHSSNASVVREGAHTIPQQNHANEFIKSE